MENSRIAAFWKASVAVAPDRGHPVRQRAQPAYNLTGRLLQRAIRAARSGGQDVRAPLSQDCPAGLVFVRQKHIIELLKVNQWASNTSRFIGASVVIAKPHMWSSLSARTIVRTSLVGTVLSVMRNASIR